MRYRGLFQRLGVAWFLIGCQMSVAQNAAAGPIPVDESATTWGTISSVGVTGSPVVSFEGDVNESNHGSTIALGWFVVAAPTVGTTTYDGTPFTINFHANTVAGAVPTPDQDGILSGVLEGYVSSRGPSSLTAHFAPGPVYPGGDASLAWTTFRTGEVYTSLLPNVSPNGLKLTVAGRGDGDTFFAVSATIGTSAVVQVPEPGAAAVFLCAIAAFGMRRWVAVKNERLFAGRNATGV
ncbi:MAG: hypothetical protein P4L84_12170 [Isosphaeraceae bacterium]|nr:hypothetical protein [Isosphaeraceae bacterium]